MKQSKEIKNTALIGFTCIFTYLVSYLSRNVLSVVTPILTKNNLYTKGFLGMLTTIYFAVYSISQLINGTLGDRIRSKYMILIGCTLAGISMASFPLCMC